MGGHVACTREMRTSYKISVETPEGKRPLGKPRRRLEDYITMGLEKQFGKVWTGFIWLRKGTSSEIL
jgi:hypothetical protein